MTLSKSPAEAVSTMATRPAVVAPVLSTPDTHIFEAPIPAEISNRGSGSSDEELYVQYEVQRTVRKIRSAAWTRVALQFPDDMLPDAVRVYELLDHALNRARESGSDTRATALDVHPQTSASHVKLCILGDTSYGACCVDEIAAEHVDAQVVVHYGRTCLSATAKLPVVYVFTTQRLDLQRTIAAFKKTFVDKYSKVVLVADAPYATHLHNLGQVLRDEGYTEVFETDMISDGQSPIPNRNVPDEVIENKERLRDWHVFHIGQPPTALLLTLSSRVASMTVYSNHNNDDHARGVSSALNLRRRYALVTSLSTCSVYGILINTLSVKNYLNVVERVKKQIQDAGKKHYTFVVGKVNAAKIANFSEIGGWVVIGCWESSLVESSEFYVPLITPFELQLALQADDERVWTGEWTSNFEAVLQEVPLVKDENLRESQGDNEDEVRNNNVEEETMSYDSDEESAPPEFDLRTGRYISHSRPLRHGPPQPERHKAASKAEAEATTPENKAVTSLVTRPKGDIARVGGIVSPGAEYLRSQRTWQGLGSDFELETDFTTQADAVVEEGRSGVARGYTVGADDKKT